MLKSLFFLVTAMLLASTAQVLLKYGMTQAGRLEGFSLQLARAVFTWPVLAGLILFGLSALFWLVLLSREKLSFVYPMVALNYVFVVILSRLFFKEGVSAFRMAALLVICVGVALYGFSESASTPPPTVEGPPLAAAE